MTTKDTSIKRWYIRTYPDDELGYRINDISFSFVYQAIMEGQDFYEVVGVYDSVVRERLFFAMSGILNVKIQHIYDLCLLAGRKEVYA